MPNASSRCLAPAMAAEETIVDEGRPWAAQMERIAFALHEMCQPLMTLQCRLEIGKMVGTPDGYEEAVKESLVECDRLLRSVDLLRSEVVRGIESGKSS